VILREEFVFVTNNARDFRKLMGETVRQFLKQLDQESGA
jgi:hypothetical protein